MILGLEPGRTMRRLVALTLKESREHLFVLLALAMTLPFGWALFVLATFGAPTTVTYLESHVSFARWVLPFAGLALGNRLVVAELHGKTARFLESLPMRRFEPYVVKWVFGFLVLEAIALASLGASSVVAVFREPMDATFLAILTLRTFFFVLFGWSFFFTMGLFGKARVLLYLVFSLGLVLVASTTELELLRFGPFALAGPEMSLEREDMPWGAIVECLLMTAFLLGAGGALTMLREGSVQERLSQPMSQRDLAMVGISVFAVLMVWSGLEEEAEPLPYVMSGDHVMHSATLPIAIGYGDDAGEPDARALMERLERDVGSARALLGLSRLPQLRVVLRRSLDGRYVEPVTLAMDDGMLVRANFRSDAHPDLEALSAEVIAGMLDARTRRRSRFEPRRWLREGFALWVASRATPEGDHALSDVRLAQAAWITRTRGPDAARFEHFERLRESASSTVARALAAVRWTVATAHTPDHGAALARAVFPGGATDDVRTVLREWWRPARASVTELTRLEDAQLDELTRSQLVSVRARPDVQAILRALPDGTAAVTVEREANGLVAVVIRAHTSATTGLLLSVRHVALGPFDRTLEDIDLTRQTVLFDPNGDAEVRLSGRYAVSDRVLVRVDLEGSALDAPMRLAAERLEIR